MSFQDEGNKNFQNVGNAPYIDAFGFNGYGGERAIGYSNMSSLIFPLFTSGFISYYYPNTITGRITSRSILPAELDNGGNRATFRRPPRAKVKQYTRNGIMEHDDTLDSSTVSIEINQQWYYSLKMDDIDYKQIQNSQGYLDNYQYSAMQKIAQITDTYVFEEMIYGASKYNTGATAGVTSGLWDLGTYGHPVVLTENNIYQELLKLSSVLTEANIPINDRFLVLPAELNYALNTSSITLSALNSGLKNSTVFNGISSYNIAIADCSAVYYSNIMPKTYDSVAKKKTGYIIMGRGDATGFIAQMQKSRILETNPNSFDRYMQGLFVFGGKVLQPEALAILYYTYEPKNLAS